MIEEIFRFYTKQQNDSLILFILHQKLSFTYISLEIKSTRNAFDNWFSMCDIFSEKRVEGVFK